MTATKRQIRDGGDLRSVRAPEQVNPIQAAAANTRPVESPARILQDQVGRYAAGHAVRLPREHRSQRGELSRFILGAVTLWGCTLGGIGALLVKAAM
ncbi:hypothetical protein [Sphingomonas montanisoli]|uniref:Uncharacterized protein n=1 Tax=Sphingomonas montanisoli TaxID=2606412 RepID=A0A5D9CB34_9SPHN|nr:hypothetical protein [Sphingomonas montanisoli]TZG28944.1 hypothetical protein FYJ91_02025 [Sphingomonas montanisoli]